MKWSERYATGIASLDDQHKMLFQMSEAYREALEEDHGERVYGLMLESLGEYARTHFGLEEGCMHRYRCPAAAMNIDAHGKFLETMARFGRRYEAGGFSRVDAQKLIQYVDDWLADHIGRIDVQLKPCVENT